MREAWLGSKANERMGKHNGKSRNKGLQVGGALMRRKMGGGPSTNKRAVDDAGSRHTTESGGDFNTQSIVEMNDLDELMNMVGCLTKRKTNKTRRKAKKRKQNT